MKTILLACMANNRVIGNKGQIPWMGQFPEDMRHFRELTLGRAVVMGRKTFESIGRPLPNRDNIVVSRTMKQPHDQSYLVRDNLQAAINHCRAQERGFCLIIGGAEIYREAMPHADHIFLTRIHKDFEGDAYFPAIDESRFHFDYSEDDKNEHFGFSYEYWDRK
jgi:dihydrofolate reductase